MQRVKPSTVEDDWAALTLYDLHAPALYSYIYRRVGQPQDAEDLLLEIFTIALKYDSLTHLAQQQQIAWLKSVAQRRIVDRHRHNARVVVLPLEQASGVYDDALTPEEQALQHETYQQLYAVLAQLPQIQQDVVRLRYGQGLPFAEIATMLEKSEGTIRKMAVRILRRLRTIYASH